MSSFNARGVEGETRGRGQWGRLWRAQEREQARVAASTGDSDAERRAREKRARRDARTKRDRVNTSWFEWPRREHSTKPLEFLDLVERVAPGPYAELFARTPRLGWDGWGDGYEQERAS